MKRQKVTKLRQACYIAGKIGGLPEKEYKASFKQAKREVKALGMRPVSPVDLPHKHGRTWAEYMKEDLIAMLKCKHLYAMTNWRQSPGATIEINTALSVGIDVIHQQ
jgi:hypothetical protein